MAKYIGIYVSKASLAVYLPFANKSFQVNNNEQGFADIISHLTKHYADLAEIVVVFEPTGGYEYKLREFLKTNKINFTTVHPNKVRSYAKAKGLLAKTDRIDCKLLSDYAITFALPVKQCYSSQAQENLHALIQRREQLILFKNQDNASLETEYNSLVIQSIEAHLKSIDEQLEQIQKAIKDLCDNDIQIKDKIAKLTSIPGIGLITAITTICAVQELGNIESRQLTALVGLAPFARESGKYKGKRSIYAGKGNLRKVIYMAAAASLRCNKKIKTFYDRLIDNHKPPKVALVACMRKLLCFMNILIKNNSTWAQ